MSSVCGSQPNFPERHRPPGPGTADARGDALHGEFSISRAPTIAHFLGLEQGERLPAVRAVVTDINGGPGIILYAGGRPLAVLALDIDENVVQVVRLISSPAKLGRLTLWSGQ